MALFKTKRKKTEDVAKKSDTSSSPVKELKEAAPKAMAGSGVNIVGVLRSSHVTEKSTGYPEGVYVFSVSKDANKIQVRQAVQSRYRVGVRKIRIINLPAKARRRGKQIGWKPGIKKAVVLLKEGEKIEIQ